MPKGIREAQLHNEMSTATKRELDSHALRIAAMERLLSNNEEFHQRIEPILTSIQESIDAKKWLNGRIFSISKVVGAIGVIIISAWSLILFVLRHVNL